MFVIFYVVMSSLLIALLHTRMVLLAPVPKFVILTMSLVCLVCSVIFMLCSLFPL